MIKLITAKSRFGIFESLKKELKGKTSGLDGRNLVFCEEKVSLMTERVICSDGKGSFNTDVYSFGNYLRAQKSGAKTLSKEGSAMVVKRVLGDVSLLKFNRAKTSLAPSMFELISQLKSANVTADDAERAAEYSDGILSQKLRDVATVYEAYEKFLSENDFEDQTSALRELPSIIKTSAEIKNADVYIVGYTGFTAETLDVVRALISTAKNVTAILPEGDNRFAFVNETADAFRKLCASLGVSYGERRDDDGYLAEGKIIADGVFNPLTRKEKFATDRIFTLTAKNPASEAERVAETIKELVLSGGCRYRDITVIVSSPDIYKRSLKSAFDAVKVPYFFDERKVSPVNPLITFVERYIDVFKYGLSRKTFAPFFKNPLVCEDKSFADEFDDYLFRHNVDYSSLKKPLINDGNETYEEFEDFRKRVIDALSRFDVMRATEILDVKAKIERASERLIREGENEDAAVNDQIYDAVTGIISEMREILGETQMLPTEYGRIFSSGVAALELSIIPQYNDAVFIGGFKEAALTKAKYLFAIGLTSDVPKTQEDCALLTDDDIDRLAEIKVLVEPKIKIVNHRERENVATGIAAWSEKLFVSYPVSDFSGGKNVKSEVLDFIERAFTVKPFPAGNGYLTEKQGLKHFAYACGRFIEGVIPDFTTGASYYAAVGTKRAKNLLEHSGKEIKIRLNENARALLKNVTSPTSIEDFYKCPYRSFIVHGLGVKERDDGKPNALKNGNLAHEIFKAFTERADNICETFTFKRCYDEAVKTALSNPDYGAFKSDAESEATLAALIRECEKYCKSFYEWLKSSDFKTDKTHTEVRFGDGGTYPAVPLLGGKIKLSGKIDRVDTYKDYCRIIDYKTGQADASEEELFGGVRVQLYLYAAAVNDKKLAGAYYIPVADSFKKVGEKQKSLAVGKTLDDESVIIAQDRTFSDSGESEFIPAERGKTKIKNAYDEKTMNAFVKYALYVSENAARGMENGLIAASPYEGACKYCGFRAICGTENPTERKVNGVDEITILNAVEKDVKEDDGDVRT